MYITKVRRPRRYHSAITFPGFENLLNDLASPYQDKTKKENVRNTRPAANSIVYTDHYKLELALPGFTKEDINISLEKNNLKISVTKEETESKKYKLREFDYGKASRSFVLPKDADSNEIKAAFDNGILVVTINKRKDELPRSIEIK